MSSGQKVPSKVTTVRLSRMKQRGERIVCLTAYDFPTALILDKVGCDLILIGDSAANVVYGMTTTLGIGMEEMLCHTRAVVAGVKRALVVSDMPFLSYQASVEEAVKNAGRFLKVGAEAVKVEGAGPVVDAIKRLVDLGIPVMGHLGLTPQSVHKSEARNCRRAAKRSRRNCLPMPSSWNRPVASPWCWRKYRPRSRPGLPRACRYRPSA